LLNQQNHLLKYGQRKYFVTTTKCLVLSTKRLVAAAKLLVAATQILFVVPNFVAVTKPFFPLQVGFPYVNYSIFMTILSNL